VATQVDYFLQIQGVEGESAAKDHIGWIQLAAWHWAEENAGTWSQGGGGGAGKVQMKDFEFRMPTNKASPKLFKMCATGEHIKKALLVCRKSGNGQKPFLKVSFEDVLVSSYRTMGNVNAGFGNYDQDSEHVVPTDVIRLNFAKIEFEYMEQNPDGSMGAPIKSGYDLKASQAI
jgi:type VI secretion system secreted protein Hcp